MAAGILCIVAIGLMICLVANERIKKNQSFNEDPKENVEEDTRNSLVNDPFVNNWVVLYCLFNFFK